MGSLGLGVGLGVADSHSKWRSAMEVIENVLLMASLMALGAGLVVVLLVGFVNWMEIQSD